MDVHKPKLSEDGCDNPISTDSTQLATKGYADSLTFAGAPDASTTQKGIVQLPTQAQVEAGTATGSTGASLALTNDKYGAKYFVGYAADAGGTDSYAITLSPAPTAYFTGMLALFKANTANTGACSLNVNSLGAKSLYIGGTDPITGTIPAGADVLCVYNGTQFDILAVSTNVSTSATAGRIAQRNSTGDLTVNTTPTASTDAASKAYVDLAGPLTFANGVTTRDLSTASGSQTIAHGLGKTPKFVRINGQAYIAPSAAEFAMSDGVYNGTTTSTIYNSSKFTNGSSGSYQGTNVNTDTTNVINLVFTGASQVATVSVDSTNITLSWTKTGTPTGTGYIRWEAYA